MGGEHPSEQQRRSAGRTGLTRDRQIAGWFDTPVFSFAQAFRFGNVARTMPDVRNPGLPTIDFSLFKKLRVKENVIFQIRAEAFNMTNTVQLGAPNAQFGSGQTGVTGGTAVGPRQVFKRGRPRDFANESKRKRICSGSLRKMPPPEILPQHVIRN